MPIISTLHFGRPIWVTGKYGDGAWHYAPFLSTQRHLACGKLTPDARQEKEFSELWEEEICVDCLKFFREERRMRRKRIYKETSDSTVVLDGSHDLGYFAREQGKFGSYPKFDLMDDESSA